MEVMVMAGFDDIVGYEDIKAHLTEAIKGNKISHAYIFDGEDGCGKRMMAQAFAMAIQCTGKTQGACNECKSCKMALSYNHPDIIWVEHEKDTTISVDEIRKQLVGDVLIRPYQSDYKIYIIDDAELLNEQAQNAMLKTIEEPPEYVCIILLTNNSKKFLPTILSRCITLNFKPINIDKVTKFVAMKCQIPDYQARLCAQFSQGNIGKAMMLATGGEITGIKDEILTILKYSNQMTIQEIIEAIRQCKKHKLTASEYIDFILMWYRDILMYKATGDINQLMYKDEVNYIKNQAKIVSYEGVDKIVAALDTAKKRLKANVNFDLTMELMLLTIKENSKE